MDWFKKLTKEEEIKLKPLLPLKGKVNYVFTSLVQS